MCSNILVLTLLKLNLITSSKLLNGSFYTSTIKNSIIEEFTYSGISLEEYIKIIKDTQLSINNAGYNINFYEIKYFFFIFFF